MACICCSIGDTAWGIGADFGSTCCCHAGSQIKGIFLEKASVKSWVASFLRVRLMRITLPSMRWKVFPTREKILEVFTQKL